MQPCLHGLRLEAEKIGGFLDGHSLDEARNEDGAKRIRKLVDRLLQHCTNFTLRHALLRIAAGRRGRKVDDFRLVAIGSVALPVHRRTPAPQPPKRLVHRNARDPRTEGRITAEHIETGEGADIGFLHHVLGLRIVAQDAPCDAEQAAIVAPCDSADRGLIAPPRHTDQILIAEGFCGGLLSLRYRHGGCTPAALSISMYWMHQPRKGSPCDFIRTALPDHRPSWSVLRHVGAPGPARADHVRRAPYIAR